MQGLHSLSNLRTEYSYSSVSFQRYGGSFQGLMNESLKKHNGQGSALQLVELITETFPSFRDEVKFQGRTGTAYTLFLRVELDR